MKTITTSLALLTALAALIGCSRQPDLTAEVIAVPTMVCGMCADNVEQAIFRVEGVKDVDVDTKAKTAAVKFVGQQTNLQTIERAISDAGYDANDVKRDPVAYENLDACCKIDG